MKMEMLLLTDMRHMNITMTTENVAMDIRMSIVEIAVKEIGRASCRERV